MNDVDRIVAAADQAVRASRWADAERLWTDVLRLSPRHPRALYSLGMHALQRNDTKAARDLLTEARAAGQIDLPTLHALAVVNERLGDTDAEIEALDAALALDAYFLPCLLAKAGWLERNSTRAAAAAMYRNVLKVAPPEQHWPPSLRAQLLRAREILESHGQALHSYLNDQIAGLQEGKPAASVERWREAAAILAGRSKPYVSEANQLAVPRLPAIPFYDRSMFQWAAALEAKTDVIRAELQTALAKEQGEFAPYIAYRPGDPVNQWADLNHSARWSHYSLWRGGVADEPHLAACPQTRAALEAVDMATIDGLCPNAMFSALSPHTEIPPHTGETNARLVVHLPLIVPDKCSYRVGFEQREWRVGEILVFDDTIEHTARNDSDELRVVLIFDIWNPLIPVAERATVSALARAVRTFGAA
jgi:aspartyl/asparaginyl beta-hydroxylase (cupin superfamily)